MVKAPRIKCTVIKKLAFEDLIREYHAGFPEDVQDHTCGCFQLGDEFIFQAGAPNPVNTQGFCPWAYCDIQRDIEVMKSGGSQNWMKNPETFITCCTDGLRPVVFKLERLQEGNEEDMNE